MLKIRPSPSLAPSKLLMQVLGPVTSSYGKPILDAPSGFGRNALALASLGYERSCSRSRRCSSQISQGISYITIERVGKDRHALRRSCCGPLAFSGVIIFRDPLHPLSRAESHHGFVRCIKRKRFALHRDLRRPRPKLPRIAEARGNPRSPPTV